MVVVMVMVGSGSSGCGGGGCGGDSCGCDDGSEKAIWIE